MRRAAQTAVATFDTTTHGPYASLVSGNLAVSGIGGAIRIANDYPNQYNGRGAAYLGLGLAGVIAVRRRRKD